MRIAQVAPLAEAVPPRLYGGTERVVSWLTETLVAHGHDVTLFASGDSRTRARLVPVVPTALRLGGADLPLAAQVLQVGIVQSMGASFDVVHVHADLVHLPALGARQPPVLTTMHGRLDIPGVAAVLRHFRSHPLVSISHAQRAPVPDAAWIATVHHGLPLDNLPLGAGAGDYVVFLGRMSPEKRPDVAIRLARRAGIRLVLAAKVESIDEEYFESRVRPLLKEPGIEWIGEVDEQQKVGLLGAARALLFPILWPEPFGLAMIEAMACGTPVITRRCGATPEVVADGRTGFVCDDDDGVVRALARLDRIDRAACRRWVEERFSAERMTRDYEAVYARLTGAQHVPRPPRAVTTIASRAAEPSGS
jgi:glycosyltransferase involved in cell wall biosynthesis